MGALWPVMDLAVGSVIIKNIKKAILPLIITKAASASNENYVLKYLLVQ